MRARSWPQWGLLLALAAAAPVTTAAGFSIREVLSYPYVSELAASDRHDVIAWVRNLEGVRNVWAAQGPAFTPVQLTHYTEDDGQELTQLAFSADGRAVVYVRGGDHDANWPAEGNLAPDPADSPVEPVVAIWSVALGGGEPRKIADGDTPAISARGQLAYTKDHQVWTAPLEGAGKPERLFFDRGQDGELRWSADGSRLAFVSDRGDHAFIGIFTSSSQPLTYLAPTTSHDLSPRWSPDGTQIAFVRRPGTGGAPVPMLQRTPHPWSIWVANTTTGIGHVVWRSPESLAGSYPEVQGEANLNWAHDRRLIFLAYLDDWPHLYSVDLDGGAPLLLTAGSYMVEDVAESRDRRFLIYSANTGTTAGDFDRRHLFRVPVDRAAPIELTSGASLEWQPVAAAADRIACIYADARQPPGVELLGLEGSRRTPLAGGALPAEFPLDQLIEPRPVSFQAADGVTAHGQLFERAAAGSAARPAVIFVHGGPPRQMLLGWHYMDYYSNAYAVNQYLAAHGFIVLSVNYRLGIGYGRAFHQPEHAGPWGAAEYQDVVAGAKYLQGLAGVDGAHIGIWGGSYGGYLTALALARNSDLFKAGVDLHGVHDWSRLVDEWSNFKVAPRFEKGDREEAVKVAWGASPDADVASWRSPVLLIQGDDDRNVPFQQTVDLARRLEAHHVPFEELVIPNEIHGFLRHATWLEADQATADFFARTLRPPAR
jgi:dipeptidyl aminopeptidase/acylaminoacyl peptidase